MPAGKGKGGGGDDILKKLEASITKLSETVNSLEGFIKKIEDDIKFLITNIGYFSENLKKISESISDVKVISDLTKNITFVKNQFELLSDNIEILIEKIQSINIPETKEKKKIKPKGIGGEEKPLKEDYNKHIETFVISIENASKNVETFSKTITDAANGLAEIIKRVPTETKTKVKKETLPTAGISRDIVKHFNNLEEALNKVNSNLEKLNSIFNNEVIISARIQTMINPLNRKIESLEKELEKAYREIRKLQEQNDKLNAILNEQKNMKEMQQNMSLKTIKELSAKSFKAAFLDILTSRMSAMLSANFIPVQTFLFNFGGLAVGYLGRIFGQGGIQKSWLAKLHRSLVWGSINQSKSFTVFSYMLRGLTAPFKAIGKALGMKPKTEGKPAEKKGGILSNLLGGGKPPEKPPTGGGGGGGGGDEKKNRNLIAGLKGALKGFGLLAIATGVAMIIDMFRRVASIIMDLEPIKMANQMMMTMLKLVFLPVGMMLMGILIPMIIAYLRMMQEVGWGNFINLMFNVGKIIGNIFALITKVFGAKNIMTAIMGMVLVITAPLIAITLLIGAIMVIITTIAGVFGFIADVLGKVFGWISSKIKIPTPNDIANALKGLFNAIGERFEKVIGTLSDNLIKTWNAISGAFTTLFNSILGAIGVVSGWLGKIHSWFMSVLQGAVNDIKGFANTISGAVSQFWGWISGSVMSAWNTFVSAIQGIQKFLSSLPHFQSGGYVPATTVAVLHAGETVVPKGKTMVVGSGTNNIVINIHNEIHGAVDVDRMTDEIYQQLQVKLRRLRTW